MRRRPVTLLWTRRVGLHIYHQRYRDPHVARHARAGQFVHLLPDKEHLYRRAMSVYATDSRKGSFDILFQVLGPGTRCLASLPVGSQIDALGPLGNHFALPSRGLTPVLVAGGVGMAPLRLWAVELTAPAKKKSICAPVFVIGVRTRAMAVAPYELAKHGIRPVWASDDGSKGFHGTSVAALLDMMDKGKLDPRRITVYGCGPEAMMRSLALACAERHIPCQVSLERSMPCGYGVCMGCVVPRRQGSGYETYYRVCRDGPVFDAASIVL